MHCAAGNWAVSSRRSVDASQGSAWLRGNTVAGFGQQQVLAKITAEIRDALSLRKTLVVWLVEESSAAASLTEKLNDEIGRAMGELFSRTPIGWKRQSSGSVTKFEFRRAGAGPRCRRVRPSAGEIKRGGGEQADLFAAAQQAIEKFLAYRDRDYEVIFVVVGVLSSENQSLADKAIAALRRKAVAVFGIGPAVPFGHPNFGGRRGQMLSASSETKRGAVESLFPERIQLEIADRQGTQDLDDSGYGPFSMERLCRQTGGKFFRLHDTNPAGWELDPAHGRHQSELLRDARLCQRRAIPAVACREQVPPGSATPH